MTKEQAQDVLEQHFPPEVVQQYNEAVIEEFGEQDSEYWAKFGNTEEGRAKLIKDVTYFADASTNLRTEV